MLLVLHTPQAAGLHCVTEAVVPELFLCHDQAPLLEEAAGALHTSLAPQTVKKGEAVQGMWKPPLPPPHAAGDTSWGEGEEQWPRPLSNGVPQTTCILRIE